MISRMIIKFTLMSVICIGFIDATCEDMWSTCKHHLSLGKDHYKSKCKNDDYMPKYCPELCRGDCDHLAIEECVDKDARCPDFESACSIDHYVITNCKVTCKKCPEVMITTQMPTGTTQKPTTTTQMPTTTPQMPTTTTQMPTTTPQMPTTTPQMPTTTTQMPTATTQMPTTTTQMPTTTTQKPTTTTQKPITTTQKPTTTMNKPISSTNAPTTTKKPDPVVTNAPVIVACADKQPMCFTKLIPSEENCKKYGDICIRSCGRCSDSNSDVCANLNDRALDCARRDCQAADRIDRHRAHIKCAKTCCKKGQLMK